ncbi:T9SS type A sorting domain-containing protein [Flavilitoribacter nigricans]|uniref:Secretion system C-terminal sorting domain-containing protein n=1 Tax=Flavilitoribacter nigricans (strain ATCC 23147 / DSM 23189 / NBRC 102662 / NCIMB 1420 / SS-2) TaxID=1122177 RepID=A0A2D0NFD3_FLAN2|nr:T9SS type A sorting domain-containing protein [Flavilitoribacter nigricans]PHN07076.1 hypothetical protein CRP01_07540 [Flavilitoribacter nigricans DSM 23189 = NBRC 102662]
MKKSYPLLLIFSVLFSLSTLSAQSSFINEVNYMASDPTGRGLEVAGESGENLQGWSVVLYELDGAVATVEDLEYKLIPSQQNGYGTVWYEMEQLSGGQGIALVNPSGDVVQFIGVGLGTLTGITATEGPAAGMTSEHAGTQLLPNQSLQMTGSGVELLDFLWSLPLTFTPGDVNTNQTFEGGVIGAIVGGLFGYQASGSNNEQLSDNQINISAFPNPATNYLRLQRATTELVQSTLPVALFDAAGRLIQRTQLAQDQDYLELNLSDLSAGNYFLRVGEGPAAKVQKIVKN